MKLRRIRDDMLYSGRTGLVGNIVSGTAAWAGGRIYSSRERKEKKKEKKNRTQRVVVGW
jgi:hypothetical protein